jgi:hypothetical protein
MELYFTRLALYQCKDMGIPLLLTRANDFSNWLLNRGFQITGKTETHLPSYDTLDASFARYGITPCSDVLVDLDVKRRSGRKLGLSLELASNNRIMISEVYLGLREECRKLKVEEAINLREKNIVTGNFQRLEYEKNTEMRIVSVAGLKDFLGMR